MMDMYDIVVYNIFFTIIYFFTELVGLCESIATFIYKVTNEFYVFVQKVSNINISVIYDYKLIKPQILRKNAQWSFWID